MSDVPESIMSLVNHYLKPLLVWFSDKVYGELIEQAQDHFLVKLKAVFDFAPLEKSCRTYHHTSGAGTKPTHTVPRLVRALLVKYLFNWSLRQIEIQTRYNLVIKWFVGYGIFAAGPDHSTLSRFEQWVTENQRRSYFDESLHQIDQDFPEDREKPQMGDTYALQADAAKESLVRLLRHTCQRLLHTLAVIAPTVHQHVIKELDHVRLFGSEEEPSYFRMSQDEREAQLRNTVVGTLECARSVQAQLVKGVPLSLADRHKLEEWLTRIDKILGDERNVSSIVRQPMRALESAKALTMPRTIT